LFFSPTSIIIAVNRKNRQAIFFSQLRIAGYFVFLLTKLLDKTILVSEALMSTQVSIRDEVNNVFRGFGISDMEAILENEAILLLLAKESKYQAEYNQFKAKYNSEFKQFREKVDASGKEDFKIEDDLMDWEFATNALKTIQQKKKALGV
jgi:hypothetical protein